MSRNISAYLSPFFFLFDFILLFYMYKKKWKKIM